MLAFPGMLVEAAKEAGMKCPEDPDNDDFDVNEYPHFHVFCSVQLGKSMRPTDHWHNAKVIAAIPDDKIKRTTYRQLEKMGFV